MVSSETHRLSQKASETLPNSDTKDMRPYLATALLAGMSLMGCADLFAAADTSWCIRDPANPPCDGAPGKCTKNLDGTQGGFVADTATVQQKRKGLMRKSYNLPYIGINVQICENAQIYDHARIYGNAEVTRNAYVSGNAHVYGNALVSGNAQISGNARVFENAHVSGNALVSGNAQISGNEIVHGVTQVYDNRNRAKEKSPPHKGGSECTKQATHTTSINTIERLMQSVCTELSCNPDEVDLRKIDLSKEQDQNFINLIKYLSKTQKDDCYQADIIEDYKTLSKSVQEQGWNLDYLNIYQILQYLKSQRKFWIETARDHKTTIFKKIPMGVSRNNYATCYVDPKGGILIDFNRKLIGQGSSKRVYNIFKIKSGTFSVKPKALLLSRIYNDTPTQKEVNQAQDSLMQDYAVYEKISRRKLSGKSIAGLLHGKKLQLSNKREALIQSKFDGNLLDLRLVSETISSRSTPITPEQRKLQNKIWLDVATGLENLHDMGLVHGDLKPANILFNKKTKTTVLSDYGLTFDPTEYIQHRSTAIFEAPEMVDQSATKVMTSVVPKYQKRDIYALGMTMLRAIPGYEQASLCNLCGYLWVDHDSWGAYGQCIKQKAPKLYNLAVKIAEHACGANKNCTESIMADSLNPNPLLRPTSAEVKARLIPIAF